MAEILATPAADTREKSRAPDFNADIADSLERYRVSPKIYIEQHPSVNWRSNDYVVSHMASGAVVIATDMRLSASDADGRPTNAEPSGLVSPSRLDPTPRILLLRRAATDSMPNLWEVPGGAVDDDDPTILHGVARELFEEAGLQAKAFRAVVGSESGQVFATRRGRLVAKLHFLVEAKDSDVRLDENEHSDFCWATEEECNIGSVSRAGTMMDIPFTKSDQRAAVLEGFEVWRSLQGDAQQQKS